MNFVNQLKNITTRKEFWVQLVVAAIMVFLDVHFVRVPMILIYAVFIVFIGTFVAIAKALICKEKTDYKYKFAVVGIYVLFLCLDVAMISATSDFYRNYKGIHALD